MKTCKICGQEFEPFGVNESIAALIAACAECSDAEIQSRSHAPTVQPWEAQWREVCPPLYQDTDKAKLPPERLKIVSGWQYGPRGMVLVGKPGTQKTRCAWLLVGRMLREGRKVSAFDAVDFELDCSEKFFRGEGKAWVNYLANVDLVFFDDLGKCKLTERVESTLFGLFEKRIANKKPILATTNDTGATLEGRMSEGRGSALVRRVREFCECVNF